jgi:hypothetical protein
MKKLILFFSVVIWAGFCQAQYQWTEINSPTVENLQTATIADNGDIYVFGNNAFGAKSSDSGQTWEIITDIDNQSRNITTCSSVGDWLYVAGDNGLVKEFPSEVGWADLSLHFSGTIEKIASDLDGNPYFFPLINGVGSRYGMTQYDMDDSLYDGRLLYNFYLPFPKLHPLATNYRYRNCMAGNSRLISFVHNLDNSGILKYIFVSDDQGSSWRQTGDYFSFPIMRYIVAASFNGSVGYITGMSYGGGGIYLYSSNDNGETWMPVEEGGNTNIPKSVYADFDGIDHHGIVVGLETYGGNNGFVKVDSGVTTILCSEPLNYITGKDDVIIIVGDSGKIFLGSRTVADISEPSSDASDLLIFPNPSNGVFKVKSEKIINDLNLYDISGKLLQSHKPQSQSFDFNISDLPIGVYLVEVDEIKRRIVKQ